MKNKLYVSREYKITKLHVSRKFQIFSIKLRRTTKHKHFRDKNTKTIKIKKCIEKFLYTTGENTENNFFTRQQKIWKIFSIILVLG